MDEALQYELIDDESMLHREIIDEEGDVLIRSGIRECTKHPTHPITIQFENAA